MSLWQFFVVSEFSTMLYAKKQKPGNAENQQKVFYMKKASSAEALPLL